MDYGLIGKLEKAKRYAEDRKRFQFDEFSITFHGDNAKHKVAFHRGNFECDCEFFITHKRCGHTMAVEILLRDMYSTEPHWETVNETESIAFDVATSYKLSLMSSQKSSRMTKSDLNSSSVRQPLTNTKSIPNASANTNAAETQEFHIEGELSTSVLQEAITPYLSALADLQHVIDQMANKPLSKVAIREIVSHD